MLIFSVLISSDCGVERERSDAIDATEAEVLYLNRRFHVPQFFGFSLLV